MVCPRARKFQKRLVYQLRCPRSEEWTKGHATVLQRRSGEVAWVRKNLNLDCEISSLQKGLKRLEAIFQRFQELRHFGDLLVCKPELAGFVQFRFEIFFIRTDARFDVVKELKNFVLQTIVGIKSEVKQRTVKPGKAE